MTTREIERKVLKCHRYWPDDDIKAVSFGKLVVHHVHTKREQAHLERKFIVRHQESNEEHIVMQLCFMNWPDHVGLMT